LKRYIRALWWCTKEFPEFDCVGHLTYYCRQNPAKGQMLYSDAPDELDALFLLLRENGKGLEVNTSTKNSLGYFMPDYDMLERYRQLGGEIVTIGSDSHRPDTIGSHYKEACALLAKAGFRYHCTYADHKPTFHAIQ